MTRENCAPIDNLRVFALYKEQLVEQGSGDALFEHPQKDYTRRLLQSIPGRALLA